MIEVIFHDNRAFSFHVSEVSALVAHDRDDKVKITLSLHEVLELMDSLKKALDLAGIL